MKKLLVVLCLVAAPVAITPVFADDVALQDAGVASAPLDAAAGSAQATPADKLHDPISDTKAAIDDVKQAKRQGWAMLAFALGVIAAKLLGRAKKWPKLAVLNKGRTAVVVGMLCAVVTAGYNALADGGSMYALGYAVVVAAFAYWNSHSGDGDAKEN